ncbi:transposase, partial [Arthrobacter sp. GCM10027362]|uniref:transposase n=1 Tax=Arthrobacter sp. GCM10027362 TaxID=3273379 RepID=UPI003626428E
MPKPYPAEFRRDVVAVARKHGAPPAQIAKDLGISEAVLHTWRGRPTSRTASCRGRRRRKRPN